MLQIKPDNLLEVDLLIEGFFKKYKKGIITMHRIYMHDDNDLSARALVEELREELKTGCVTFFNKNNEIEGLEPYLFYIANDFYKKKSIPQIKKIKDYLCPGCMFQNKNSTAIVFNKIFSCDECADELRNATDPKMIALFRTFFRHHKNGYHCQDCERFIPHPLDESPIVSCPYTDCIFAGEWSSLKRMHHPSSQKNPEIITMDTHRDSCTFKDSVLDNEAAAQFKFEIEEGVQNKIILLREIIEAQKNNVSYSSSDSTIKHKILVYQAFDNLIRKFPVEMIAYLLDSSRSGGFQHKVFQEYIRLLEESLPFSFKKNNKVHQVKTLLDENLNLFEGISIFEALVTEKLDIKNNTKEFYIGGRKASYTKPYYIGKLLNVIRKDSKISLMNCVKEYSFSKIKMVNLNPGTEVVVTHLRVPPHYQMGGMVYVNRVRKKIVDRAEFIINKGNDA